jgi:hypothetical protein
VRPSFDDAVAVAAAAVAAGEADEDDVRIPDDAAAADAYEANVVHVNAANASACEHLPWNEAPKPKPSLKPQPDFRGEQHLLDVPDFQIQVLPSDEALPLA